LTEGADRQGVRETDRLSWIALNQVEGMEPGLFIRLTEIFGGAGEVWRASEKDLRGCGAFGRSYSRNAELNLGEDSAEKPVYVLDKLLDLRRREDGSQELKRAQETGVKIFTLLDDDYPRRLRDIPDPPPVLYARGNILERDDRAVAIVGTRRCNGYGRRAAEDISAGLAGAGWTVVSGLAHGIDAAAHRAALDAGGRTFAVKAVGVDHPYPSNHVELADEIAACGAVISEFPLGMKAINKNQFHRRNRIISGLSRGVVVAQSAVKGGSMITAGHAAEHGREVFAVPGDVNHPSSGGCHWLIRNGAHLAENASQILEALGEPDGQPELSLGAQPELDGLQKRIYDLMKEEGPTRFDDICARLSCSAGEASSALMMLEMKGAARQLPGQTYMAARAGR